MIPKLILSKMSFVPCFVGVHHRYDLKYQAAELCKTFKCNGDGLALFLQSEVLSALCLPSSNFFSFLSISRSHLIIFLSQPS